ncbi:MAG: YraN family protein [Sulfurihydrogenibium sp.]|uniref:YraN family protein n=1 Tax=Sulfurihydrogenibium sp. TaxID=2053621 RepID=UPI003C7B1A71
MNKRKVGSRNENLAVKYLESKGYRILDRNYYSRYGELDIVAEKDGTVVIVEVRSLSKQDFGSPEESLNIRKVSKILKTAQHYLYEKNLFDKTVRFDVIAITKDGINHIENAFTEDFLC